MPSPARQPYRDGPGLSAPAVKHFRLPAGQQGNSGEGRPEDIRSLTAGVERRPGVYRMLDAAGRILYVGKARNLRNRLRSYFAATQPLKVQRLMARTRAIELTVTADEAAALILENDLIKQHQPRYNILFRDDKSYPYLRMDLRHPFPRLSLYRGPRHQGERYFGPYPNARSLRKTLSLLQKLFLLRNCSDAFFKRRTRPCLQYQIRRCSAPCVSRIGREEYRRDLDRAVLFLQGRSEQIVEELTIPMHQAAATQDYERAAAYRDMIARLRQVQQDRALGASNTSLDVVACLCRDGAACIQVFTVRGGAMTSNQAFFPRCPAEPEAEETLSAFLARYYLGAEGRDLPAEFLLSCSPRDRASLEQALSRQAGRHTPLRIRGQGERRRWLTMALDNAASALLQRHGRRHREEEGLRQLASALALRHPPQRIECFDVSHSGGEAATASRVAYIPGTGPLRSDYRRFHITGVSPGDDYAALSQAVLRSFRQQLRRGEPLPGLLLIDGGRGQATHALQALKELGLGERIQVVGVAKGPGRKAGLETLYSGQRPIRLAPDSAALHLVLRIRDEAHRFALQGHRRRRGTRQLGSPLESIPGVGSELRRRLLQHFGGLQGVRRAAAAELARVRGIGPSRAERIHRQLHRA